MEPLLKLAGYALLALAVGSLVASFVTGRAAWHTRRRVTVLLLLLGAAAACFLLAPTPPGPSPVPARPAPASAEWLRAYWEAHPVAAPAQSPLAFFRSQGTGGPPGYADGLDASEVPIVSYEPSATVGRNGGVVARLSRRDEPDAGYLELKLANDAGALDLWLFRDKGLLRSLDLPVGARIRLRYLDSDASPTVDLAPSAATEAVRSGNYFVFRPRTARAGAWLRAAALPALLRLEIESGGQVYVSDDFELSPRGDGAGR